MSSNNNLLLLIIAGVIALIVLHITTSNQSCNTPSEKKNKKQKKVVAQSVVSDSPASTIVSSPAPSTVASSLPPNKVITGPGADFKNEKKSDSNYNSAMSQGQTDTTNISSNSVSQPVTKSASLSVPNAPVTSNGPSSSSSSSSESVASAQSSPAPPKKTEKFSENFSYTEQSVLSEGFNNNMSVMDTISESNQYEGFSANDAKSIESKGEKNPKPDFVIKSASLGNKFGGGNFNVKLTGSSGAIGPNTTNVNGLGVVEGAPDYTLGVTPIISKEKKAKKLTAKDLLPKASKDDWFDMPYDNKQMMRIENENLIAGTATQARIGIDTQGQTLKNASHDLRAAPPNPKFNVGPWMISTIEPDYNIKPIM